MEIEELKLVADNIEESSNWRDTILDHLRGRVYHRTTREAYNKILEAAAICHNKDERFTLNTSSKDSFGRNKGWICLFDLRAADEETIDRWRNDLISAPSYEDKSDPEYKVLDLAYFILTPTAYNKLILQTNKNISLDWEERIVPRIECWIEGDMPLEHIEKVLLVYVREKLSKFGLVQRSIEKYRDGYAPAQEYSVEDTADWLKNFNRFLGSRKEKP